MKKKHVIIALAILVLGCFVRLYKIGEYPVGLNQDEASIGYEAYALANYGVDRNGNSWPVHFVAWGSGQNALYAYLAIPFVKLLGNTELAVRLPMALVGCLTLVVVALLLREMKLKTSVKLLILLLFAIMPWHVMKSRWGLESNLFPDLIFYAAVLAYFGVKRKRKWCGVASAVILGLSTYAYGTSYVFVPAALIVALALLLRRKIIGWKTALWYAGVTILVAVPMIMFVMINYFEMESVSFLGFTIPRLDYNRFTTITSVNGNFLTNCMHNAWDSLKIFWTQEDGLPLNYISGFGIFYLFSLPFIVYGLVLSFTKKYHKSVFLKLNLATLVGAVAVAVMTDPNINRVNVLWLPLFTYLGLGIMDLVNGRKVFYVTLVAVYLASFLAFIGTYFTTYQDGIRSYNRDGLNAAVKYTEDLEYEKLYLSEGIGQPYIYYIYYTGTGPRGYYRTREIAERATMFQEVKSFGKIQFSLSERLRAGEVAIMKKTESLKSECEQVQFGEFVVVDCTKE